MSDVHAENADALRALLKTPHGRLWTIHQLRGLTLKQIAERVGYSATTVHCWEIQRLLPTEEQWELLAKALDVDPQWLISGESPPEAVTLLKSLLRRVDLANPEHLRAVYMLGFRAKKGWKS